MLAELLNEYAIALDEFNKAENHKNMLESRLAEALHQAGKPNMGAIVTGKQCFTYAYSSFEPDPDEPEMPIAYLDHIEVTPVVQI